jgi:Flp pilus assembly protein TadG
VATSEECVSHRPGHKRFGAGNERGQAVVEFSLVFPLLMIVVTGQIAFGLAIHNYLVLTNAVNTGTQVLAISRGETTDPCATGSTAIDNGAFGLTTSKLTFNFVINGTSYPGTTTCTAGAANMVQGAAAQVTVSYPCALPIYGMSIPSCTLTAQTTELIQ